MSAEYRKHIRLLVALFALSSLGSASARADLTIVKNVEGVGGKASTVTIKLKGDKTRIDANPQMTTLSDSASGEIIQLVHSKKIAMRMPLNFAKGAAALLGTRQQPKPGAGKLTPTGKKETINGYEAEEFVYHDEKFDITYWVARDYPNGAAILQQLQNLKAKATQQVGDLAGPDISMLPGVPIRTVIQVGGSRTITSTILSVKEDPIPDSEFVIPPDYQQTDMSDMVKSLGGSKSGRKHP